MKVLAGGMIGALLGFAGSYLMRSGFLALAGPSDWFSVEALKIDQIRSTMGISTLIGIALGCVIGAAFEKAGNRSKGL